MANTFVARFIDRRLTADLVDDDLMDAIEANSSKYTTAKRFNTKDEAVKWIIDEVNESHTTFGQGEIYECQKMARRCQYCTCRGEQSVRRFLADDTGIVDESALYSECLDDD